jgi:metal-dependent amidase/aminoacylase/carboxypeptidase family protein
MLLGAAKHLAESGDFDGTACLKITLLIACLVYTTCRGYLKVPSQFAPAQSWRVKIVSRNLSALHEPAVVSVTEFITDGTVNVIPGTVTNKGDCRCFTDDTIAKVSAAMQRIATGICASAGANCEFEFITTFPSTINNPAETQQAVQAAIDVLGEENVNPNCDLFTISEDFANMLRVKPGCYGLLGHSG